MHAQMFGSSFKSWQHVLLLVGGVGAGLLLSSGLYVWSNYSALSRLQNPQYCVPKCEFAKYVVPPEIRLRVV